MSGALVSVILPVYNGGAFLAPALGSILAQDHRRLEVIVIDDGSRDGSAGVIESFARRDRRIRFVTRENRGLIATLNEGLDLASGEFIARMDADDYAYANRISSQVAAFEQCPDLALCGSDFDTICGDHVLARPTDPRWLRGDLGVLSMFFTAFRHPSVMFNRRVAGAELRYDADYVHAEDMELFRRLARAFPTRNLRERLMAYRLHDESVTSRQMQTMRRTHARILEESLVQEGFSFSPGSFRDAADAPTMQRVQPLATAFCDVERQAAERPLAQKESYELGLGNLFFFYYGMLRDERPDLLSCYIAVTGRERMIRRRERFFMRLSLLSRPLGRAAFAANTAYDARMELLRSSPAPDFLMRASDGADTLRDSVALSRVAGN